MNMNPNHIRIFIKNLFLNKWRYHLKIVGISSIILSITLINYFILPFEYDTLVTPYERAGYDYKVDLSSLHSLFIAGEYNVDYLLYSLERFLINNRDLVKDFAVVYSYFDGHLSIKFISDVSKIYLTEYGALLDGRHPTSEFEVQTPPLFSNPFISKISIGSRIEILDFDFEVVGKHFFTDDILAPMSPRVLDNLNRATVYEFTLYLDMDDGVNIKMFIDKLIDYLYEEGFINVRTVSGYGFSEAKNLFIYNESFFNSLALDREFFVEANRKYIEDKYGSITSIRFVYTYGSLMIFIVYLLRAIDTFFSENRYSLALIYLLGGTDINFFLIYIIMFSLYILLIIPPALLVSYGYIAYFLKIDIPAKYILTVYDDLLLYSVVITFIVTLVYNYLALRRRGFSDVLLERFLG